MQTRFHQIGTAADDQLQFAVIAARFHGQWIFVRHRQRDTWEIPGGRREVGEPIVQTARRELHEETGAKAFALQAICDYSVVKDNNAPSFGRLFLAEVRELGQLPESEIGEIALFDSLPEQLTYPQIQPHLMQQVLQWGVMEAAARRSV